VTGFACQNLEIVQLQQVSRDGGQGGDAGRGGGLIAEGSDECVERGAIGFRVNRDTATVIAYPPSDFVLVGDPVHEGAKTHALHDAANIDAKRLTAIPHSI
jgi:hypothetical protein